MMASRLIWASEHSTLADALLVAAAASRQAAVQTQARALLCMLHVLSCVCIGAVRNTYAVLWLGRTG